VLPNVLIRHKIWREIVVAITSSCRVLDVGPCHNNDTDRRTPPNRRYPPFYEKAVPIALGIIVIVIVVLLLIIVGVALDLFPGVR
jgi:hypothetical protein